MGVQWDFERHWLAKIDGCLSKVAGDEIRGLVMAGSDGLCDDSTPEEVVAWSKGAMERLDDLVADESDRRTIMTGCACHYSKELLAPVREAYSETGDVDQALSMLQVQFVSFLRNSLGLDEGLVDEVVGRGWGLAGVRQEGAIIATKIPKSGYLEAYLREPDSQRKRAMYCHCPRIRDAVPSGKEVSPTYCYCGAGYYQDIWQEITQGPVEVELLASVMAGDEVCKVAIHLPAGAIAAL